MKKTVTLFILLLFAFSCGTTDRAGSPGKQPLQEHRAMKFSGKHMPAATGGMMRADDMSPAVRHNTEEYAHITENRFRSTAKSPFSTFSIDVDTASYANVRRLLKQGQKPPKGAVRVEELINYFSYSYPQPQGKRPFSVTAAMSSCPWNAKNKLLLIGLQGRKVDMIKLPPANLVFLLDVSGSMYSRSKLPLLKSALKMLVRSLRAQDRVAITVYAGAAGLVLPSTSGEDKEKIIAAIDKLRAGGSTAGGAGIRLAYKIAEENFRKNGNNRIILATDGDFNVGISSTSELVDYVAKKRSKGIGLTVLGFGSGNIKDHRMEQLANKGNGNYAYIDSLLEARKVLVSQLGGTLYTIAKDVKLQVEFNPRLVKQYRLIGYENRKLRTEDFNDDRKDAGELGSGHSVTALYEIVPADGAAATGNLRYQQGKLTAAAKGNEAAYLKLRWKPPKSDKSILNTVPLCWNPQPVKSASVNLRFASAVALYGMLLRGSEHKGSGSWTLVKQLAQGALGQDKQGYRREFLRLVDLARNL